MLAIITMLYYSLMERIRFYEYTPVFASNGARGGVMVKALRYKRQVAGSIPDGVIGIFQ